LEDLLLRPHDRFQSALRRHKRELAFREILNRVSAAVAGVVIAVLLYLALIIVFPEFGPMVRECVGTITV
jgi:hypothetical protein